MNIADNQTERIVYRNLKLVSLALGVIMPVAAYSADIGNGWSASATISKIHSQGAATLFRLSGVSDSCGHPDFWKLPLSESARDKSKLSMLLMAHATGKRVTLRCENFIVSDFEIVE